MITADKYGNLVGKFSIPQNANIPAGVKPVEFIGEQGSRGLATFTSRGQITIEERKRITVVERYDPLAQTFTLLNGGRHLAAVGLWFVAIGNKDVTVQIRTTTTGMPTGVVLASKRINKSQIVRNGETIIRFDTPLFFEEMVEYAIVILTDDNTHSLAIAQVGQYDKRRGRWVTEQTYTTGVLLSSSNASTWTAHNNSDLAFRLYAAKFTKTSHVINLPSVSVNNASDAKVLAQVERTSPATSAIFTLSDGDNAYQVQENQPLVLSKRTTGEMTTQVTLTGSATHSPIFYHSRSLVAGDVATSATYVSRQIKAGGGVAIVYLESHVPSGATVGVEIQIDGQYQSVESTQAEPLGNGWVRHEYQTNITGGSHVRCRITLTGSFKARPICRKLRMITT